MDTSLSIRQSKFASKEIKNINNSVKYGKMSKLSKKMERVIVDKFLKINGVEIF